MLCFLRDFLFSSDTRFLSLSLRNRLPKSHIFFPPYVIQKCKETVLSYKVLLPTEAQDDRIYPESGRARRSLLSTRLRPAVEDRLRRRRSSFSGVADGLRDLQHPYTLPFSTMKPLYDSHFSQELSNWEARLESNQSEFDNVVKLYKIFADVRCT